MYITLKSIKRNLGFKGIEITDIIIGVSIIFLFYIIKTLAVVGLMMEFFAYFL